MSQIISDCYKKFSEAEGCQHIASEFAIIKLWKLIQEFEIEKILEVGLGIGSISGSLLAVSQKTKPITYHGTEDNEFCLASLTANLNQNYTNLKVYNTLSTVPNENKYDLIIIDGKDQDLKKIQNLISKNGIIVIEGDRMPQQELLQEIFSAHKFVHSISINKNKTYSPFPPGNWQGGVKIIFVNPNLKQYLWWSKEKVLTKCRYLFRTKLFNSI